MEKLAGKLKERLGIGKVDCNQHYNLCYQAKLNGFPTLYFYPGGTGQPQVIYKIVNKMLISLSQIFIMLTSGNIQNVDQFISDIYYVNLR